MFVKASSERTGGRLAAVEFRTPKDFAAPLHVHRNDDEFLLVLWGEVRFQLGEEVVEGTPGTLVFGPAGTEGLFRQIGHPALSLDLPGDDENVPLPDPAVLMDASRHGQDIVCPPLTPTE